MEDKKPYVVYGDDKWVKAKDCTWEVYTNQHQHTLLRRVEDGAWFVVGDNLELEEESKMELVADMLGCAPYKDMDFNQARRIDNVRKLRNKLCDCGKCSGDLR